jgi:uncharacterized protein (TIGR00369 family)
MSESAARLLADAEIVSSGGFNLFAGPFWRLAADADGMGARYAFIAEPKHLNGSGAVHGGLLMTFADVAMSRTARLTTGGDACSTLALTADFVGPGKLGDMIEAAVRVTRRTRTMVFQSADIMAAGRVLMVATGLWKIG